MFKLIKVMDQWIGFCIVHVKNKSDSDVKRNLERAKKHKYVNTGITVRVGVFFLIWPFDINLVDFNFVQAITWK